MAEMTSKYVQELREEGLSISKIADKRAELKYKPTTIAGRLSDREIEVVHLIVHGFSNTLIARKMNITTATAKWHVKNCIYKLGARNRVQAAIEAVRRGYVNIEMAA